MQGKYMYTHVVCFYVLKIGNFANVLFLLIEFN